MNIRERLFLEQDLQYKKFGEKLIPNIDPNTIIGVRSPVLRQIAKELQKENQEEFLSDLPHKYHEENLIHMFLLNEIKDADNYFYYLEKFLPSISNWAVSDSIKPKCFKKKENILENKVLYFVKSKDIYTNRIGLNLLMGFYTKEFFKKEQLDVALSCEIDDYYSHMMLAWYLATLAIYHFDLVLDVLKNSNITKDTKKKTIQKMKDSFRITEEQKQIIKSI